MGFIPTTVLDILSTDFYLEKEGPTNVSLQETPKNTEEFANKRLSNINTPNTNKKSEGNHKNQKYPNLMIAGGTIKSQNINNNNINNVPNNVL